jgi:hypothetical protein
MGGKGLDAKVRELTIIALVSLFSLGLAWAYEADFFAMFFAAAAAIAGVEAVRRSVTAFLLRACSQARCVLGAWRNVHSSGTAVVGASKEAGWSRLCLRGCGALHRLGNSVPSSGPLLLLRAAVASMKICEVTGAVTLCVLQGHRAPGP